jgi:hypothetical protein
VPAGGVARRQRAEHDPEHGAPGVEERRGGEGEDDEAEERPGAGRLREARLGCDEQSPEDDDGERRAEPEDPRPGTRARGEAPVAHGDERAELEEEP